MWTPMTATPMLLGPEARIQGLRAYLRKPVISVLPSYQGRHSEYDLIDWGPAFHERSTDLLFVEVHVEALLEHFHK